MNVYLRRTGLFVTPTSTGDPELAGEVERCGGIAPRRANRFTLAALAGACRCTAGAPLDPGTGLYLTTERGVLADMYGVLGDIFEQRRLLLPMDFVNTMSNMAAFHVARCLGLGGRSVVVSERGVSFESGLLLAGLDMLQRTVSSALVGAVDLSVGGWSSRLGTRREELGAGASLSVWLELQREPIEAEGEIEVRSFSDGCSCFGWLNQPAPTGPRSLVLGGIPNGEQASLRTLLSADRLDSCDPLGETDFPAVYRLIESFRSATWHECASVCRSDTGRYVAARLRRLKG